MYDTSLQRQIPSFAAGNNIHIYLLWRLFIYALSSSSPIRNIIYTFNPLYTTRFISEAESCKLCLSDNI